MWSIFRWSLLCITFNRLQLQYWRKTIFLSLFDHFWFPPYSSRAIFSFPRPPFHDYSSFTLMRSDSRENYFRDFTKNWRVDGIRTRAAQGRVRALTPDHGAFPLICFFVKKKLLFSDKSWYSLNLEIAPCSTSVCSSSLLQSKTGMFSRPSGQRGSNFTSQHTGTPTGSVWNLDFS